MERETTKYIERNAGPRAKTRARREMRVDASGAGSGASLIWGRKVHATLFERAVLVLGSAPSTNPIT